jgi:hypothetical protein
VQVNSNPENAFGKKKRRKPESLRQTLSLLLA